MTNSEQEVRADPSSLTSDQRIQIIEALRARDAAGEILTADELRYAIDLIRMDRASATRERSKSKKDAKAKSTVRAFSVDEL